MPARRKIGCVHFAHSSAKFHARCFAVPSFGYFAELRRLVNLLYPVQLESEHRILAKPVLASDFELDRLYLFRNARREGVVVNNGWREGCIIEA